MRGKWISTGNLGNKNTSYGTKLECCIPGCIVPRAGDYDFEIGAPLLRAHFTNAIDASTNWQISHDLAFLYFPAVTENGGKNTQP